ncbi:TPA: hypothetical protein F6U11_13555 [Citrobacter freundii]|uniref:Uncharacterized protein n=1 Tax=Citrobacter murliniae TaxID=67829 RepID=A0ABY2PVB8_9ENTR|nr:hypothetical protein DJ535_10765 [Citrobacter murliniae]HAU4330643.1 hypothetical protein [Citrobacter freundii]
MPEWRVNLSPKSENVIAGGLSNSVLKWLTITLPMAGCKSGPEVRIDVLCCRFLNGWFFILHPASRTIRYGKLGGIRAGLPKQPSLYRRHVRV